MWWLNTPCLSIFVDCVMGDFKIIGIQTNRVKTIGVQWDTSTWWAQLCFDILWHPLTIASRFAVHKATTNFACCCDVFFRITNRAVCMCANVYLLIRGCLKIVCTPKKPMVLLIIIPMKWLFHWEYTQHFQTNPYCSCHNIKDRKTLQVPRPHGAGSRSDVSRNSTGEFWRKCREREQAGNLVASGKSWQHQSYISTYINLWTSL